MNLTVSSQTVNLTHSRNTQHSLNKFVALFFQTAEQTGLSVRGHLKQIIKAYFITMAIVFCRMKDEVTNTRLANFNLEESK